MNGILIIDKPVGWTSHDVVGKLRKLLKTKRIGHTGTLDPFATGVLVMLVGNATRLAQFLDKDVKEYEALVQFGYETDTGDHTGTRREHSGQAPDFSLPDLAAALGQFRGEIEQVPPMYSAKKIDGKKLYQLARAGIEIERQPVKVNIFNLEVLPESGLLPENQIRLKVACSAGTYIRTLAEDIARELGTHAHLAGLRRTKAGKFDIGRSTSVESLELRCDAGSVDELFVSMNAALDHLPRLDLLDDELRKVRHGMALKIEEKFEPNQVLRLVDADGELAAIGFYDPEKEAVRPRLVFEGQ